MSSSAQSRKLGRPLVKSLSRPLSSLNIDYEVAATPMLLDRDEMPVATLAYSLRKLRADYSSYAVRVRKGTGGSAVEVDVSLTMIIRSAHLLLYRLVQAHTAEQ